MEDFITGYITDSFKAQLLVKKIFELFLAISSLTLQATEFSTDESNRMGFRKKISEKSDRLWADGKRLLKFLMRSGGRVPQLGINRESLVLASSWEPIGELEALSSLLDWDKERAEHLLAVHRLANLKNIEENRYSPDVSGQFGDISAFINYFSKVSHFIEELLTELTDEIREMAGEINVLGKIARGDRSKRFGLHLFDQLLLNK